MEELSPEINKGIEFREESDFNNDKVASIKEIILRQIRKIGDLCCQEFMKGYWQRKPIKTSGGVMFTAEYHQDTRKAYIVAVEFITDLIYPYADNELVKSIDKEEKKDTQDIDSILKSRRSLFREINRFFERDDFFSSTESQDE